MSVSRADLEADRLREQLAATSIAPQLLSHCAMEASLQAALAARRDQGDLWLFAYGSLMWNPLVRHSESRRATAVGYHRRFCLWSRINRGSPDNPGLVLGLEPGGSCTGIALRLPAAEAEGELRLLWRREMMTGAYHPRWLRLRTAGVSPLALAFVVRRESPAYAGRLTDDEIVTRMLHARGHFGAAAEYLASTEQALTERGIHDRYVTRLSALLRRRRTQAD